MHTVNIRVIEESLYLNMKDLKIPLEVIANPHSSDKLSLLTKDRITYMNDRISDILFGGYLRVIGDNRVRQGHEEFLSFVESSSEREVPVSSSFDSHEKENELYEIISLPDFTLVVMRPGFVKYTMETKENLSAFLLTLLRHTYKYNNSVLDADIVRTYMNIHFNDGYLDTLRLKLK